jgi:hypothetical protein
VIEENYVFLQQHLKMEYCTMQRRKLGSCKLFFRRNANLSEAATLSCFGYYQEDVLGDPEGTSHQNIHNHENWLGRNCILW